MKIKYMFLPLLFIVLALGTAIPGQAQTPTEDNPAACWSLDEESGTRYDAVGDMDLTDSNTVGQVGGLIGSAASIVALNNEALWAANTLLRTDQDFSLVAWVNKSSNNDGLMLGFNGESSTASIYGLPTETLVYRGAAEAEYSFPAINSNEWHLLLLEKSGDQICLGIDDDSISCQTDIAETGISDQFFIGMGGQSAYYDEVAFWQRSLSSDEQLWLFNGGAGRSCSEIIVPVATPTASVQQLINLSSGDQAMIRREVSYGDIAVVIIGLAALAVLILFVIVRLTRLWVR